MLRETLKTRGYHVGIRFAPPAPLDKHHRQIFQMKLSEGFDWRHQEFAEKAWVLASPQADGDPRSQIKLTLQPDLLNFEEFFPVSPLDLFLDNLRLALEAIAGVFSPRLILGSGAMVRTTLQAADGDARLFIGNRMLHLDDKLKVLERPIHAVGLKMLLPPVDKDGEPTYQAEVRIESLVEDVRQIFVEVDAKWSAPTPWSLETIVARVRAAHDFSTERIIAFLERYAGGPEAG